MYGVGLKKDFKAKHRLDFAGEEEASLHLHYYILEVEIQGEELDENNCLIDIVEFENVLENIIEGFEEALLNDHPEFEGNPTVERFAEVLCKDLEEKIEKENIKILKVKLWENEEAFASYRREVNG